MKFLISKNQKGLTLAECLISILLLAVTLVAGMAFYFNSGAIMRLAMHKKIAQEMVNQQMETIKRDGYAALPDADVNFGNPVTVTFGDFSVQVSQRVTLVGAGIKQVELRGTWTQSGKNQEITVSTHMAAP